MTLITLQTLLPQMNIVLAMTGKAIGLELGIDVTPVAGDTIHLLVSSL